jgi:hypothetical protein
MIKKLKSLLGIRNDKNEVKSATNSKQNISEIRVQLKAVMSVTDKKIDDLNLKYSNALESASNFKKRKDERNLFLEIKKIKRLKMYVNNLVNNRIYIDNALDQIEVNQSNEEILNVLTLVSNFVNKTKKLEKDYITLEQLIRKQDEIDLQQEIGDSFYEKNAMMTNQLDLNDPESLAILEEIDNFENANKNAKKVSKKETEDTEPQVIEDELEAKIKKLKKMIDKG